MALSAAEENQLARLLDRVQWPLPKPVFEALMRKSISVPIELGVFAHSDDSILHVLMVQRPADDIEFPPLAWHMPGTVIRDTDTIESAMARLMEGEVGGRVSTPESCGIKEVERGADHPRHAISLLYCTWLKGHGHVEAYDGPGKFFPVNKLPETTLPHHIVLLREMLKRTGWRGARG